MDNKAAERASSLLRNFHQNHELAFPSCIFSFLILPKFYNDFERTQVHVPAAKNNAKDNSAMPSKDYESFFINSMQDRIISLERKLMGKQ